MEINTKDRLENYRFDEHVHEFAVWNAARAVSRDFASTAVVKAGINKSDLRALTTQHGVIKANEFEVFHRRCANQLIGQIRTKKGQSPSYGQAAKIIAMYLKTAVILPKRGGDALRGVIHPPVDRVLLQAISRKHKELKHLRSRTWTRFTADEYWRVANEMEAFFGRFDWKPECYWKAERE